MAAMKIFSTCTSSHERLAQEWFLPSLRDPWEVELHRCEADGEGIYLGAGWLEAVRFKSETIIQAIEENEGEIFVYSDVDVEFFAPAESLLKQALEDRDIVCQLNDPGGTFCTGFFAARANPAVLELWRRVRRAVDVDHRDQFAFNRIIREMEGIRFGRLPRCFFGTETFSRVHWREGSWRFIPGSPVMFHANCTTSVESKQWLLTYVKGVVERGNAAILRNNMRYHSSGIAPRSMAFIAAKLRPVYQQSPVVKGSVRPRSFCLDASTVCQLRCRACPTATGVVAAGIGSGFLRLEDFRSFCDNHSWVQRIELSNWGEIFLNPELAAIIRSAHENGVTLSAANGVNLNTVSGEVLEALVRYRFHTILCSIDGACQETYARYRVRGDFGRVIDNIRRINALKQKYGSVHPLLHWQFIAFGHNEREIAAARSMAQELNMGFKLKLSWDDLYTDVFSPVRDRELIRRESGIGAADRDEYRQKYGTDYIRRTCLQLWYHPRVNFDGRLLGCSVNHWGDFGNTFEEGLMACLGGEKMSLARRMLMGLTDAREGIPCSDCRVYRRLKRTGSWISTRELVGEAVRTGVLRR